MGELKVEDNAAGAHDDGEDTGNSDGKARRRGLSSGSHTDGAFRWEPAPGREIDGAVVETPARLGRMVVGTAEELGSFSREEDKSRGR